MVARLSLGANESNRAASNYGELLPNFYRSIRRRPVLSVFELRIQSLQCAVWWVELICDFLRGGLSFVSREKFARHSDARVPISLAAKKVESSLVAIVSPRDHDLNMRKELTKLVDFTVEYFDGLFFAQAVMVCGCGTTVAGAGAGPVVGPTPGGIPAAAPNKLKSFWMAASCIAFSC